MVKQLSFKGYSTEEWAEFKRYYDERFWEELERWKLQEANRLLQSQIYEEFDLQIGASRYQRTSRRRDERNGYRYRNYEILGGLLERLRIPRARRIDIRFSGMCITNGSSSF